MVGSHVSNENVYLPTTFRDGKHPSNQVRPPFLLNLLIKLIAVGLASLAFLASDLPQFQGKWMVARALAAMFFALLLPALWWIRGRSGPYPHLLDSLIVLTFNVDMAGNALNLYDTVAGFDLFIHFLCSATLVTAFGVVLSRYPLSRLNAWALAVGFGATTHILWEIAEYGMMKLGAFGLQLTYANTIHDFIFSFLGTLTGAALTVTVIRSGHSTSDAPFHTSPLVNGES